MVMPGPVQPEGREMAFNGWGKSARMPAERAVYDSSETEWRPQTPVKPLSFLIVRLYFHLPDLRRTAAGNGGHHRRIPGRDRTKDTWRVRTPGSTRAAGEYNREFMAGHECPVCVHGTRITCPRRYTTGYVSRRSRHCTGNHDEMIRHSYFFTWCCRYIVSSSARSVTGVGITRELFAMIAFANSLKISASGEPGECSTTALPSISQAWITGLRGTNRTNGVPSFPANAGMTACSNASSPLLLQMIPARPVSPRFARRCTARAMLFAA